MGINTMPVGALTTAAAGFLQESCAATDSEYCGLLPMAMPVNQVSCDGSNNVVDTGDQWSSDGRTVYKVPLCKNGPGNVGWLDWTPARRRDAELIDEVENPTNGAVPLPSWQYITTTGNPNASGLETAIRAYDGQIVLVPQFDLTCNPAPQRRRTTRPRRSTSGPASAARRATSAATAPTSGTGSRRSPTSGCARRPTPTARPPGAPFGAYLNGNNSSVCDTGNGATSCLVGKFESIVRTGTIGAGVGGGTGNSKAVGVQIIK